MGRQSGIEVESMGWGCTILFLLHTCHGQGGPEEVEAVRGKAVTKEV